MVELPSPDYVRTMLVKTKTGKGDRKVVLFRFSAHGKPDLFYRWVLPGGALRPVDQRTFAAEVARDLGGS